MVLDHVSDNWKWDVEKLPEADAVPFLRRRRGRVSEGPGLFSWSARDLLQVWER